MPASFDPEAPRYDADELDEMLARTLARSAAISSRSRRRRSLIGTAGVGLVVVALVLIVALQAPRVTQPAPPTHTGRASVVPQWKLVADVSAGWHVLPGPGGVGGLPPLDMACPSATTCYAMGLAPAGVARPATPVQPGVKIETTTDGGETWTPVALPVPLSRASLSCVSASKCALLGINSSGRTIFLKTSDGGRTWSSRTAPGGLIAGGPPFAPPGSVGHPAVLDCVSASECTAAVTTRGGSGRAAGYSLKTSDGGRTWLKGRLSAGSFPSGLACTTGDDCVVTGSTAPVFGAGAAARSTDGGVTWTPATLPPGTHALQSVECDGSGFCITSSSPAGPSASGAVLTSSDSGATWAEVPATRLPRIGFPLFAGSRFSCPTSTDCWTSGVILPRHFTGLVNLATSHGFLAQSTDGGRTWQPAPLPRTIKAVLSVACPTKTTCYAMAIVGTRSGVTFGVLSNHP